MKTYLLDIWNKFMKYRDYLLVILVGLGVFFFVQRGQAVKQLNPDQIWQDKWKDIVPATPPADPAAEGVKKNPLNAPSHAADIFKQVQIKDIEAISSNPIWTRAGDYTELKTRLEALKKDYQDAITAGDAKTARDKLTQYCKDDPKGRIIQWPSTPQTILNNLVCEQTTQVLLAGVDAAKSAAQAAAAPDQSDLMKGLDSLNKAYNSLKQAIDEASLVSECAELSQGGDSRLSEAKTLLESLGQTRENMNLRMIRQEYESLMQAGSGINEQSDAAAVASVLQRMRDFRELIKQLDPDGTILDQARLDRLQEIQTKVESGKESRITQVRQNITNLTTTEKFQENREVLDQILKEFDTLEKLGDPKAAGDRREYDGYVQKLEAAEIVTQMNGILDAVEKDIEEIKKKIEAKEDTAELVKKVTDNMDQLDEMRKKPSVRRAPGGPEANKRWTAASNDWKRVRQKMR